MRSGLTPNLGCCEKMTICLWWRAMIGRPLDCDALSLQSLLKQLNCFQLILTWSLVTKIRGKEDCFLPEWHGGFSGDDLVICCRRRTITPGETISSDGDWSALFVQRSTDTMSDSKAWMNYPSVYFHSLVKLWDKPAPCYWCHLRAGCHSKMVSSSHPFIICFLFLAAGLWEQAHSQCGGGGHQQARRPTLRRPGFLPGPDHCARQRFGHRRASHLSACGGHNHASAGGRQSGCPGWPRQCQGSRWDKETRQVQTVHQYIFLRKRSHIYKMWNAQAILVSDSGSILLIHTSLARRPDQEMAR